jgi:hypothetical protein
MQPSKSVSSDTTIAPFASGWSSCATDTLSLGKRTSAGISAAAQYAASAAEVSPVDAHAIARTRAPLPASSWRRFISRTAETSTVIPRSLNEPVWLLPHCLIHTSDRPRDRP